MRPNRRKLTRATLAAVIGLLISSAHAVCAQTAPTVVIAQCNEPKLTPAKGEAAATAGARGGLMLSVTGVDGKPVARKRFFLLEKSVREIGLDWQSVPAQESFYRGASPELLNWLREHDFECDTLYCPEYQAEYDKARLSVREFREAYDSALAELKNPKLAVRWMMVYFPLRNARLEYYRRKSAWVEAAARKGGAVKSAMTDERGIAFLTDLKPGDYYLSNVVPLARGSLLWNCPVKVGPIPHDKLSSADVTLTAPPAPSAP